MRRSAQFAWFALGCSFLSTTTARPYIRGVLQNSPSEASVHQSDAQEGTSEDSLPFSLKTHSPRDTQSGSSPTSSFSFVTVPTPQPSLPYLANFTSSNEQASTSITAAAVERTVGVVRSSPNSVPVIAGSLTGFIAILAAILVFLVVRHGYHRSAKRNRASMGLGGDVADGENGGISSTSGCKKTCSGDPQALILNPRVDHGGIRVSASRSPSSIGGRRGTSVDSGRKKRKSQRNQRPGFAVYDGGGDGYATSKSELGLVAGTTASSAPGGRESTRDHYRASDGTRSVAADTMSIHDEQTTSAQSLARDSARSGSYCSCHSHPSSDAASSIAQTLLESTLTTTPPRVPGLPPSETEGSFGNPSLSSSSRSASRTHHRCHCSSHRQIQFEPTCPCDCSLRIGVTPPLRIPHEDLVTLLQHRLEALLSLEIKDPEVDASIELLEKQLFVLQNGAARGGVPLEGDAPPAYDSVR